MTVLPVSLFTACVLGIAYVALSIAVGVERGRANLSLGLGDAGIAIGDEHKASALLLAVRRHGQFAEYVPLSILLVLLLELNHTNRIVLVSLAAALIVSRLCMTLGLGRRSPNPLRTAGNLLQWSMIAIAAGLGLVLAY